MGGDADFVEYDKGETLDPIDLFWHDSYDEPRDLTGWVGLVRIGSPGQAAIITKTAGIVGMAGNDDTDPPTPSARITFGPTELDAIAGQTHDMLIRFTHPGGASLGVIDWKNGRFRIRVKNTILAGV